MNRRSLVALAFSAMLVLVSPAWAQGQGSGNGNGGGPGGNPGNGPGNQGNNNESSPGSNGNGPGNGNGESQGNGHGAGNGNGNAGGASPPAAPETSPANAPAAAPAPPAKPAEQSESDVLAAVEAGRAVPLSSLMPDVRTRTGGDIIDAELVQAGGALLYAVRVLAPDGRVSTEYYDARSGQHVER